MDKHGNNLDNSTKLQFGRGDCISEPLGQGFKFGINDGSIRINKSFNIAFLKEKESNLYSNSCVFKPLKTVKSVNNAESIKHAKGAGSVTEEVKVLKALKVNRVQRVWLVSHLFQGLPQLLVTMLVEGIQVLPHCVCEQNWVLIK